MKIPLLISLLSLLFFGCKPKQTVEISAQSIVDQAIAAAGGNRYSCSEIFFNFRDKAYFLQYSDAGNRLLKRSFVQDSNRITDVRDGGSFTRIVNGEAVKVHDTMARKYANSINSVHYFAYLPYGLNDRAVKKRLLGEARIKDRDYYKLEVTFSQDGGGDDFEDTYIYWFDKETFKPDYLAYEFHIDGGGMRFREAFNERVVNGIRFVDYHNFKPSEEISIYAIDSLYLAGRMELLSEIELQNVVVNAHSCN